MNDASLVQCTRCGARVASADTVYSRVGALLCLRCGSVDQGHAQLGREREAELARAGRHRDAASLHVDRRLAAEAVELESIVARGPRELSARVACQRCRTEVDRSTTQYAPDGRLVCEACLDAANQEAQRAPAGHDPFAAERNARLAYALFIALVAGGSVVFVILYTR